MKYYTQFLVYNTNGDVSEAVGSDGVFILDGRCGRNTMIEDSRTHMRMLKRINKYYIGFRIMKGTRFDNSTLVHEEINGNK